ncbi:hypothetical protein CBL_10117 [Carabus blaptoides fortunei]
MLFLLRNRDIPERVPVRHMSEERNVTEVPQITNITPIQQQRIISTRITNTPTLHQAAYITLDDNWDDMPPVDSVSLNIERDLSLVPADDVTFQPVTKKPRRRSPISNSSTATNQSERDQIEEMKTLQQKSRTKNFDAQEKESLLDIVEKFKGKIENKKTDAVTSAEKSKAW